MVNFSMMFHALSYREIYLFHFNTVLGPFGRCFHFHIMYVQYVSLSNIFILTLPSLHQSICDTLHYFCVKYLCGIFLAGWFEKFLKEKKKKCQNRVLIINGDLTELAFYHYLIFQVNQFIRFAD